MRKQGYCNFQTGILRNVACGIMLPLEPESIITLTGFSSILIGIILYILIPIRPLLLYGEIDHQWRHLVIVWCDNRVENNIFCCNFHMYYFQPSTIFCRVTQIITLPTFSLTFSFGSAETTSALCIDCFGIFSCTSH